MELQAQASATLLERASELAGLEEAIVAACSGSPSVLLIEGPAGIGKTELLRAMRRLAERAGMLVLTGRGGELERELSLGVARQLLEPVLAGASAGERAELLEGPAAATAALFGLAEPGSAAATDEFAGRHGLYWLCVRLAERSPLLIVIDDLHWCDAASLRWLTYLVRRQEGLPIVLAAARRTDEAAVDEKLLAAIAGEPSVGTIRPAPLSPEAVGELTRGRFEDRPEQSFVRACHEAAGGNPLFTLQLLEAARAQGMKPLDVDAEAVARLAPERVAQLVLDRLRRCSPEAVTVAEQMALLGTQSEVRHVAGLSGLAARQVLDAADELTAAGLVQPTQPLEFVHPIVRSAIHESLPAGRRAAAHERAARMLDEEGAAPARVALHLLEAAPAADPRVVEVLRAAASTAMLPEAAASYLRRAVDEPPAPADRADILLALGLAESRTYDPDAIGHLQEALRLSDDPGARAAATTALADSLVQHDRAAEAGPILRRAIAELSGPRPERGRPEHDLLLGLEAELLHAGLTAGELPPARLAEAIAVAGPGESPAELELLAMAAYVSPATGATAAEVAALAAPALGDGRLLELENPMSAHVAIWALEFAGCYEEADRRLQAVMAVAQRRGSPSQFMLAASARAEIAYRRGALADAEQDARIALELADAHGRDYGTSVSAAALSAALAERGRLEEAEGALGAAAGGGAKCDRAVLVEQRGRLRLARGEATEAAEEFRLAGLLMQEAGHDFPGFSEWRVGIASAALASGEHAEAAALAQEQLGLVRPFGAPGPIGVALRTLGLAERGKHGLELLAEAVAELERSPARLECAKAQLELGAALRRAGKRTDARRPLRKALDLADRCGAVPVAERAREELVAAGARPRRTRIGGVDGLTAGELRVARRAASGRTNREIAQELFVTKKAVEKHLASVYRKLEIAGRGELPAALGD